MNDKWLRADRLAGGSSRSKVGMHRMSGGWANWTDWRRESWRPAGEKHYVQSFPAPWVTTRKFQEESLQYACRCNSWEKGGTQIFAKPLAWPWYFQLFSLLYWIWSFLTGSVPHDREKLFKMTSQQQTLLTLLASWTRVGWTERLQVDKHVDDDLICPGLNWHESEWLVV